MAFRFDSIVKDLIDERKKWESIPGYKCFWSGLGNEAGLRLTPVIERRRVWLRTVLEKEYSGIPGIVHGGIPWVIIDGLMGWLVMSHLGRAGVTTNSKLEYKGAVRVGEAYIFEAVPKEDSFESRTVSLVGRVFSESRPEKSLLIAEADYFLPSQDQAEKILGFPLTGTAAKMFPQD
jgi:acyl-coenzyme A thioesterase PaaI-like protein